MRTSSLFVQIDKMEVGKFIFVGLLLIGLAVLNAGCQPGMENPRFQPEGGQMRIAMTPVASPTAIDAFATTIEALTVIPTSEPVVEVPLPYYQLVLKLDVNHHQGQIEEAIHWVNSTGQALDVLPLVVEPQRYEGVLTLQEVVGDRGTITIEKRDKNLLWLKFENPLEKGEQLALRLNYELNLPEIPPPSAYLKPQVFGYTQRQINLVDWYPFIPPFQNGDWSVHTPGYFGEHLVYPMAGFEVTLVLEGAEAGWVVAASAPPQANENTEALSYVLTEGRTFALSLSPYYEVDSKQVGEVTVLSHSFPESKIAGQAALEATADALAVFSVLFKPYSRNTLSVVEADFLDAMEFDGLYFLSKGFYNLYDGTPKGYLTMIAAHETAHQWWFGMVGNDQALEPWVDEALCTYSERLFYESFYPDLVEWWWSYRVNFYQPEGPIDLSIYDYGGYQAYRNAVYLRGAIFFEDLRRFMGDEAFFAALQTYAQQHSGKLVTAKQLLEVFIKSTSKDVTPLLKQYFSQKGDLLN